MADISQELEFLNKRLFELGMKSKFQALTPEEQAEVARIRHEIAMLKMKQGN